MSINTFTTIYHDIEEAIMLRDFTKRQRKVIDLIMRLSWGCGKDAADIPRQRDFCCIGIAESHVSAELKWLSDSQIIVIDGTLYGINDNPDQWQVSRVKPYTPEKLTELVRHNLNGTAELTKTGSKNLPKQEVKTYQNRKFSTRKLASPKEKKRNIRESIIYRNRNNEKSDPDEEMENKYLDGKYGSLVITDHEGIEDLKRERELREKLPNMAEVEE